MVGIKSKVAAIAAGVMIVLLLITGVASYHVGKANARVEIVEKEVEKVVEREVKTIEYVEKRVPVVQEIIKTRVEYVNTLIDAKEKLDDAIQDAPDNPACTLTGNEYRMFQTLIGKTNAGGDLRYSGAGGEGQEGSTP